MGLKKFAIGCALGLLLSGCALGSALERGHNYVGRQEYRAALAAYQQAQKIDPESGEARRLANQMMPYAVREASAEANAEMAQRRHERAFDIIRYVARLDRNTATQLHAHNSALMQVEAERLISTDNYIAAYELSARMRGLYPRHRSVKPLLTSCREHFYAASEQHAKAQDFRTALATLNVVQQYEPSMKNDVAHRRASLEQRWAVNLATRGAEHETAQRHGAAAALYGRAYEVGQQNQHLDAMRRNSQHLRKQGRFVLAVHTTEKGAASQLVSRVSKKVRAVEGLSLPTDHDDGASLIATISSAATDCRQQAKHEQGAQPYVSGHRQEVNPTHTQVASNVAALERDVDSSKRLHDGAVRTAGRAQAKANHCDHVELPPVERRAATTQSAVAEAKLAVQRLKQREKNMRDRLDGLPPQAQQRRPRIEKRLQRVRKALAEARRQLHKAKRAHQQAQSEFRRTQQLCVSDHASASRAQQQADQHDRQRRGDVERLATAQSKLSSTPAHVTVEVLDTFMYTIEHVTRSCEVSAALALQPAWTSGENRSLRAAEDTRDTTHSGYPRYGVAPNPLRFASSDAELIDNAHDEAASDAAAAIAQHTAAYYEHMTQNAVDIADNDPHGATDLMLAMLLAAPGQLTKSRKERLSQHLAKHYDLKNWQTLTK